MKKYFAAENPADMLTNFIPLDKIKLNWDLKDVCGGWAPMGMLGELA